MSDYEMLHGDCLEKLKELPDCSVDAVVTDPPYELGFMGRGWDASGIAYDVGLWREVLRVLKPGGHLLAFGATRTYHRMAVAIEDAGFEIRDSIAWVRGGASMPKGLDIAKAFDKAAGALQHEGRNMRADDGSGTESYRPTIDPRAYVRPAAVTEQAKRWEGWHTATKPMLEPIVVARKAPEGTIIANIEAHGVGAFNVGACRIGTEARVNQPAANKPGGVSLNMSAKGMPQGVAPTAAVGRWPPNVIFSHLPECPDQGACPIDCPVAELLRQWPDADRIFPGFRYATRPSAKERHRGVARNTHPTVKPVELMRWLVRLVTPKGGTVLDPFTGSGTTGVAAILEGFRFIGCEREDDYFAIAKARIDNAVASLGSKQEKQPMLFDLEGM